MTFTSTQALASVFIRAMARTPRPSSRTQMRRCTRRRKTGRHSYQFFTPAMNVRAVERQSIEESLRRALERQEFTLHYQPKINLRTGEISGAEALLRWMHPIRGLVPPAQF